MAMAIPIMMGASAAMSAYGAYQQGQAGKAAANYNAAIGEQNAVMARDQARMDAQQIDRENFLRLGSLRANRGAMGGDTSGSVLDVIADVTTQGELDRHNALYKGEMAARGYQTTAALDRMNAKASARAGNLSAAGTLIGGIASAAGSYRALNVTPDAPKMPPATRMTGLVRD